MKLILQDSEIEEKLAFPVRKELGEYNINIIYSEPVIAIKQCFHKSKNTKQLIMNLPEEV